MFLIGLVLRDVAKRRKQKQNYNTRNDRKFSHSYFIYQKNNVQVIVCKQYFLDTFQISNGRLHRLLRNTEISNRRGQSGGSRRNTAEHSVNEVKEHISSFPAYESHYTRSHHTPGRKYLSPYLDIRKMYNLYKDRCIEQNIAYVKEWTYRKVFNNEFNLHFHHPRKDTCQKCDLLKSKITVAENDEETKLLTAEHNSHLENAENANGTCTFII